MVITALAALAANAAVLLAAVGCGWWVQAILPANASRAGRASATLVTGLGLLSWLLFLAGQLAFTPAVVFVIVGTAAAAGVWLTRLSGVTRWLPIRDELSWLPALLVCAITAGTMVAGLAELAGGTGHDGVSYHLLGPKQWLALGAIRPLPEVSHAAFPASVETLFGALLAMGASRGPGMFAGPMVALLAMSAAELGKRIGLGSRGIWWVAALVITMPAAYVGATWGFVDAFYATVALTLLRVGLDVRSRPGAVLFGVLAGILVATKYTGVLAAPLITLVCVPLWPAGLRRHVVTAFGVALAVASPVYVRNWIVLHSPIYPPPATLLTWFTPRYLTPEAVGAFDAYIHERGAGLGRGWMDLAWLPYRLTVMTARFHGAGGIGPALLGLAPIGLWAARRDRAARAVATAGLLLAIVWFYTQQESRFLIAVYVIGAVFAIAGWRTARLEGRRTAVLSGALITLSLVVGTLTVVRSRVPDIEAVVSPAAARAAYLQRVPFASAIDRTNAIVGQGRVLILEPTLPVYYLTVPYVRPIGLYNEHIDPRVTTPAAALDHLSAWSITHVLDTRRQDGSYVIAFPRPDLTLVAEGDTYRLYSAQH